MVDVFVEGASDHTRVLRPDDYRAEDSTRWKRARVRTKEGSAGQRDFWSTAVQDCAFFETSWYCYFLNLLVSLTNSARTVSGPNPYPT